MDSEGSIPLMFDNKKPGGGRHEAGVPKSCRLARFGRNQVFRHGILVKGIAVAVLALAYSAAEPSANAGGNQRYSGGHRTAYAHRGHSQHARAPSYHHRGHSYHHHGRSYGYGHGYSRPYYGYGTSCYYPRPYVGYSQVVVAEPYYAPVYAYRPYYSGYSGCGPRYGYGGHHYGGWGLSFGYSGSHGSFGFGYRR